MDFERPSKSFREYIYGVEVKLASPRFRETKECIKYAPKIEERYDSLDPR